MFSVANSLNDQKAKPWTNLVPGKVWAWYLNLRDVSIVSFADQQSLDLLNRSGLQKIAFALQQIVPEVRKFSVFVNGHLGVWLSLK